MLVRSYVCRKIRNRLQTFKPAVPEIRNDRADFRFVLIDFLNIIEDLNYADLRCATCRYTLFYGENEHKAQQVEKDVPFSDIMSDLSLLRGVEMAYANVCSSHLHLTTTRYVRPGVYYDLTTGVYYELTG